MADESKRIETPEKQVQEVTPEEKLFRLIAAAGKDDAELQELLARFAPQKKGFGGILKTAKAEKLMASPILRSAALVFLGALAFYFLSGIRMGQTFYVSPGARFGEVGIEHAGDFFPNFFNQSLSPSLAVPGVRTGFSAPEAGLATAGITLPAKEVKPFRLVGISWDAQGPVAMVESGPEERAKFVRAGDVVAGNVRVEEIRDYTIVLSSGNKKWELT